MVVKVTMLHEKTLPHSRGYQKVFLREKSKWEFQMTLNTIIVLNFQTLSNFKYFSSISRGFQMLYTSLATQNWSPN